MPVSCLNSSLSHDTSNLLTLGVCSMGYSIWFGCSFVVTSMSAMGFAVSCFQALFGISVVVCWEWGQQLWFVGNGDSSYGLLGMGTAVVVCWEWGQQLWLVWNGDSSCGWFMVLSLSASMYVCVLNTILSPPTS